MRSTESKLLLVGVRGWNIHLLKGLGFWVLRSTEWKSEFTIYLENVQAEISMYLGLWKRLEISGNIVFYWRRVLYVKPTKSQSTYLEVYRFRVDRSLMRSSTARKCFCDEKSWCWTTIAFFSHPRTKHFDSCIRLYTLTYVNFILVKANHNGGAHSLCVPTCHIYRPSTIEALLKRTLSMTASGKRHLPCDVWAAWKIWEANCCFFQ